jgi:hypothetical protein
MTFSHFLPFPGGGNGGYLNAGSPPPISRGVRGVAAGWVLRPCLRAGGGGGQGTTLTHDKISYVLSQHSLNFTSLTFIALPNSGH